MTELSPAAQAVLDSVSDVYWDWAAMSPAASHTIAAAALRAAADHIQMRQPFGNTDADAGVFAAHQAIHAGLLAIATELEAQ